MSVYIPYIETEYSEYCRDGSTIHYYSAMMSFAVWVSSLATTSVVCVEVCAYSHINTHILLLLHAKLMFHCHDITTLMSQWFKVETMLCIFCQSWVFVLSSFVTCSTCIVHEY
jgi:hypothetical protein